jgi:hypothetical protein
MFSLFLKVRPSPGESKAGMRPYFISEAPIATPDGGAKGKTRMMVQQSHSGLRPRDLPVP